MPGIEGGAPYAATIMMSRHDLLGASAYQAHYAQKASVPAAHSGKRTCAKS